MTNRTILEGEWEEAKGRIREAWGSLTDDELEQAKGNWEQLVGTIRRRTGESLETVESRLNDLLDSMSERVEESDTESGGQARTG